MPMYFYWKQLVIIWSTIQDQFLTPINIHVFAA